MAWYDDDEWSRPRRRKGSALPALVALVVTAAVGFLLVADPGSGSQSIADRLARAAGSLAGGSPGLTYDDGMDGAEGSGGPGYSFEDEFHPSLQFDRPGLLAMANEGPNTNGSQFFITDRPRGRFSRLPTHLNNRHTIFGEVVEGLDVVGAIADVPVRGDQAVDPVAMNEVEIVRVGAEPAP